MANHPTHDDDSPAGRSQGKSEGGATTTTETGPRAAPGPSERGPSMACLLRGPHHLGDETLGPARPAAAVTNAARPDAEVVVGPPHGLLSSALIGATALRLLKLLVFAGR